MKNHPATASGGQIARLQQRPKAEIPKAESLKRQARQNRRAKLDTSEWDALSVQQRCLLMHAADLKRLVISQRAMLARQDKLLFNKFFDLENWLLGFGFNLHDCAEFYAREAQR